MADWVDLGDGYAQAPNGQQVPVELLPPTERLVPPTAPTPAPMVGAPMAPGGDTPVSTPATQAVLSKLDQPAIAAARGQPTQLPIAQQSTTTQSAVPMSTLQPILDRGTQRAQSQADAVIQAGEQRAQTGERQAMTAATAAYGQQQQSQAEAEQARQRAEIARLNQVAFAAQEDPAIDPDRFVRSMSTGQSIGTVILAGIEGAFRGMTGQPGQSGVLNILERRIDQDLAAQKEQIASGRIRRGNMIQYFREQGMNEEAAEKAAKAMAYAQAEKLTQAEIARIGAGGARAEASAMAEQIKAAREQANDELMLTLGTPRSSTTTVRQAPQAAGPADPLKEAQLFQARLEELDAAEIARVISEPDPATGKQRPVSVKRAKSAVDGAAQLAEKLPRVEVAEQQLSNVLSILGVPLSAYNRERGTIDWSQVPDLKGVGPIDAMAGAQSFDQNSAVRNLIDAQGPLQESITYLTTGAVASPTQVETFKAQAGADVTSEAKVKANLERTANQIFTQKNSMLSGNPDAVRLYQSQRNAGGNDLAGAGFKRQAQQ